MAIAAASKATKWNSVGATVTLAMCPYEARMAATSSAASFGQTGDLVDFFVGEAGEFAEATGELDRAVLVLAAGAAEGEELVDDPLELEGAFAPLRVVRR